MGNLSVLKASSRSNSALLGNPLDAQQRIVDIDIGLKQDELALFGSASPCSYQDLALSILATPGTPVITVVGTGGAVTYTYVVVDVSNIGAAPSATGTTGAAGNAVLSAVNYNSVVLSGLLAGHTYSLYRTLPAANAGLLVTFTVASPVVGVGVPTTYGQSSYTYKDVLLANTTAAVIPTTNTTGTLQLTGPAYVQTTFPGGGTTGLGGKVVLDGAGITLTAAQCLADILVRTGSSGALNDTLPTAAILVAAAGPGIRAGALHRLEYRNEGSGTTTIIGSATGITLRASNTNTITNAHSRVFTFVFTAVTAGAEAVEVITGSESAF